MILSLIAKIFRWFVKIAVEFWGCPGSARRAISRQSKYPGALMEFPFWDLTAATGTKKPRPVDLGFHLFSLSNI
jgi:hypothetical protein